MAYRNGAFYSGALATVLGKAILGAGTTLRTYTLLVSVDAIVKNTKYLNVSVDADLKESLYKNYTTNALLKQTYLKTYSTDAYLDYKQYLTYNVDGKFVANVRLINIVDAELISNRRSYGVDARIAMLQTVPLTQWVDAYLDKPTHLTYSIDAYFPHKALQYNVDTHLKAIGTILAASVDSLLSLFKTLSYSIDCAYLTKTETYAVDSLILNRNTPHYSVDAVLDVAMHTEVTLTIQTRS